MKYFSKQISISQIIKSVIVCSLLILGTSELIKAIGTADDPLQAPQLPQLPPSNPAVPAPAPTAPPRIR